MAHLFRTPILLGAAAASLALTGACEPRAPDGARPVEPSLRDSAGVAIVEYPGAALDTPAPFRLAPDPVFSFGELEGAEEDRFTSVVAGARLDDGRFVIVDDREAMPLRVLDAEGSFVTRIGTLGDGPGELGRPAGFRIDPEGRVLVWDAGRMRIHRFGSDGEFDRDFAESELGPGAVVGFHPDGEGGFLLLREAVAIGAPEPGLNRRRNGGHLLRAADGTVDTLSIFDGTEWELRLGTEGGEITSMEVFRPWYLRRLLHAFADDGSVWLADGTRWEVARREPAAGDVDLLVRFERPREPFTEARADELLEAALEAAADEAEAEAARGRLEQAEYPEWIPPVSALFTDAEGRLWIGLRRFPPGARLPWSMGRALRDWVILEPGGRSLVGRLELPPRSRPLYADAEGVLLATVDELDIPRVEWRLLEPR